MKLNVQNVNKFMQVIHECKDNVYLRDCEGGNNLNLNLKSELSLYIGISKLLEEHGDWLEIYADNKEDERQLMKFMWQN